ncbi:MAG: hypothetical protein RI897_1838 [Verrucomicrobiota bacterium]
MADGFAEGLEVEGVEFHGADEGVALGHAVAIGSTGDEELVFLDELEVALGGGWGVFGVEAFDAVEAGFEERFEVGVGLVDARVGEDGDPAGLVEELDGVGDGDSCFWCPGGAVTAEEALEGFVDAAADPFLDEGAGDVGAAWGAAIGEGEDFVGGEGDLVLLQAFGYFAYAVLAALLEGLEGLAEGGVLGVESVAEEVEFCSGEFGGEFGAVDEFDVSLGAGCGGFGAAFGGIVIGERYGGEVGVSGALDEFLGGEGAVGVVSMEVEVGGHEGWVRSGRGGGLRRGYGRGYR